MAILNKPTGLNVLWAATGVKTSPDTSKIQLGWIVEIPPYQYQNWLDNRQDAFIAHTNQQGVPSWDPETEYQGGLSYTKGSDGVIYKCLVTNTNSNPTDSLNRARWVVAFEVFGSVAVVQAALTQHLNNYSSLSGITNIVAARSNLSVYSRAEVDAGFAIKAGSSTVQFSVANPTAAAHAISLAYLNTRLVGASEGVAGIVALASVAQAESGVSAALAINPAVGQAVYLKKSGNLAGMSNYAQARANLGLTDTATTAPGLLLFKSDNLQGLSSPAAARTNLGLGTIAVWNVGDFNQTALNLSDVPNKASARINLGLTDTATSPPNVFLYKTENLSGLSSPAIARDNLGLGSMATQVATSYMAKAENLAGLTNVQAARNNLGLSAIVTKNVNGLSDPNGDINFVNNWGPSGGGTKLPNGVVMNWGTIMAGGAASFAVPFTSGSSYSVTVTHGPDARGAPGAGLGYKSATSFSVSYGTGGYQYIAIGI